MNNNSDKSDKSSGASSSTPVSRTAYSEDEQQTNTNPNLCAVNATLSTDSIPRTPQPISKGDRLNDSADPYQITMADKNKGRVEPGLLFHSPPDQQQQQINTPPSTVDGGANDQTLPTGSTSSLGNDVDNNSGEGAADNTGMCML